MTIEDWNDFWPVQQKKNKSGSAKYCVTTDKGTPEDTFVKGWIEKWQDDFLYFDNVGCGCCINMYEFDAPEAAISELCHDSIELVPYEELGSLVKSSQPTSFLEFGRSLKKAESESF